MRCNTCTLLTHRDMFSESQQTPLDVSKMSDHDLARMICNCMTQHEVKVVTPYHRTKETPRCYVWGQQSCIWKKKLWSLYCSNWVDVSMITQGEMISPEGQRKLRSNVVRRRIDEEMWSHCLNKELIDSFDQTGTMIPTMDGVCVDVFTGEVVPREPYTLPCTQRFPVKLLEKHKNTGGARSFLFRLCAEDETSLRSLLQILAVAISQGKHHRKIIIFQGSGNNGKSTLISALAKIMGDAFKNAPLSAFLDHNREAIREWKAGLLPDYAWETGVTRLTRIVTEDHVDLEKLYPLSGRVLIETNEPVDLSIYHRRVQQDTWVVSFTSVFSREYQNDESVGRYDRGDMKDLLMSSQFRNELFTEIMNAGKECPPDYF